jgi:hypothetical protein
MRLEEGNRSSQEEVGNERRLEEEELDSLKEERTLT